MSLPASRIVPLVVAAALFMENLDGTVIATALPEMSRELGVSPVRLNLAITSYMLAMAVFIPASGWMADRFGARRIFIIAIALFLGGSVACGAAPDLSALVVGRLVQGIGGAMMVPVGRLIMLRAVPKSELVNAMAWLTVPALLGPVLGPPVGGFITTFASWRWIFWINVPIGILGIIMAWRLLPPVREENPAAFDLFGFLASSLGLAALVLAFETAGRDVLTPTQSLMITALGIGALGLYGRHARHFAHPLIDLSLLRIQTFRVAVLGGSLFRVGVGAVPFLLPLQLQVGFGRSAMESGLTTFIAAAGAMLMKMTAARIITRFGFRPTLTANALLAGCLLAAIGLIGPTTPLALVMSLLFIGGFFRSLEFTAINAIAFAEIDEARMSRATSFSAMAQQISLSAGVALGASILHLLGASETQLPRAQDISLAFIGVGVLSMLTALAFSRLPRDAGREMIPRGNADT